MQKRHFHYRNSSLYNRNFRTLFLICMTAMVLVTVVVAMLFSGALFTEVSDQSLEMVTLLSENMDRLQKSLDMASDALVKNNTALHQLMFDRTYDHTSYVEALSEAWTIQGMYPNLLFLANYNPYQEAIFSTITMTDEANAHLLDWIREHPLESETSTVEIFDIKMMGEQDITDPLPTMVLLKACKSPIDEEIGIAMVGIDCGVFHTYLMAATENDGGMAFMLNEKGRVMSHSNKTRVKSDYSGVPYVQEILHSEGAAGIISPIIDGERRIVAYSRNESGWTLVKIAPSDSIFSRLFFSRNLLIFLPLLILLFEVVFSLTGARITFLPIHELLQPYSEKMSEKGADLSLLISQMNVYREKLDAQITGTAKLWLWRQLPPEDMMTLPELFEGLHAPRYVVGLLRVDRSIKFLILADSEQNKVTSALRNECMDALEAAGYA